VRYEDVVIESSYRADLIVEGKVILKLKSVDHVLPAHTAHTAQTLTYLRLSGREAGLLLNFGAPRLVDGIRRFVPQPGLKSCGIESERPLIPTTSNPCDLCGPLRLCVESRVHAAHRRSQRSTVA
jgi:hypothetical protein